MAALMAAVYVVAVPVLPDEPEVVDVVLPLLPVTTGGEVTVVLPVVALPPPQADRMMALAMLPATANTLVFDPVFDESDMVYSVVFKVKSWLFTPALRP